MTIYRTAHYRVQAEALARCEAAQHIIVEATQAEPGTLLYLVLQDTQDPTRFVHFSVYSDDAALAAHIAGEPMGTQIREVIQPAIVEATEFTHYTLVDGKLPAVPVH